MTDLKTDKLIHIPVLDEMRSELKTKHIFEKTLDASGLKTLVDSSIQSYMKIDSSVSIANGLKVELEGQQAYIDGTLSASKMLGMININIAEYSMRQSPNEKGRLELMDLKYFINANKFAEVFGDIDGLKAKLENSLRDPNVFVYNGIKEQLPPDMALKNFGLYLEDGKLRIKLEV